MAEKVKIYPIKILVAVMMTDDAGRDREIYQQVPGSGPCEITDELIQECLDKAKKRSPSRRLMAQEEFVTSIVREHLGQQVPPFKDYEVAEGFEWHDPETAGTPMVVDHTKVVQFPGYTLKDDYE